jgi:hypothetical protein
VGGPNPLLSQMHMVETLVLFYPSFKSATLDPAQSIAVFRDGESGRAVSELVAMVYKRGRGQLSSQPTMEAKRALCRH